jgi:endonuclease/exonuclease/phosphatase (EEP) superfamily protein YafD
MKRVAGNYVDHIFATGFEPAGRPQVLDRGSLSDHRPVVVDLAA